jgi:hypothetical protein
MNQGISITEIQDALRAATGKVEQTYAPDAEVQSIAALLLL